MKKSILWAMLAMLLPMTQAVAGGSGWGTTTYYYAKASVSAVGTGSGTVYIANSSSATSGSISIGDKDGSYRTETSGGSVNAYFFAKAAEGSTFEGWSKTSGNTDIGKDSPLTVSLTVSTSGDGTQDNGTWYALFTKNPDAHITFLPPENGQGTYSATDGMTTINDGGEMSTTLSITLSATAGTGYRVYGWYTKSGDTKVYFAYSATTTHTAKDGENVGVDFVAENDIVGVTTYADLSSRLTGTANAIEIQEGATMLVPEGGTLAVPSGKKLFVKGRLVVRGSMSVAGGVEAVDSGAVIRVTRHIKQDTLVEVDCAEAKYDPGSASMALCYYKTTIADINPTVSGCTYKEGAIITRSGDFVDVASWAAGAVPGALFCSNDSAKAINYVTKIDATLSKPEDKVDDSGWTAGTKVVILLNNWTLSWTAKKDTQYKKLGWADSCQKYTYSSSGELGAGTTYKHINSTSVNITAKLTNPTISLVNCTVTKCNYTAADSTGSPRINFYDCSCNDNSYPSAPNGLSVHFYSGTYTTSLNARCSVHGGTYSNNPTTCITSSEIAAYQEPSADNKWVVQKKKKVKPEIDGQEYDTLALAVAAVPENGATPTKIKLTANITLSDDVVIPANKNVIIELDGAGISAGKIVNYGALRIEDSNDTETYGDVSSAIDNYGNLRITYGNFSGAIVNKDGGVMTTHAGKFTGAITREGGEIHLRGGKFSENYPDFLDLDIHSTAYSKTVSSDSGTTWEGSYYWVGANMDSTMDAITMSNSEVAYAIEPYTNANDRAILTKYYRGNKARSYYPKDTDWYRLGELVYGCKPYDAESIEGSLVFDRDVKTGTLSGHGIVNAGITVNKTVDLEQDLTAGEYMDTIGPAIDATSYTRLAFSHFFNSSFSGIKCGLENTDNANKGTTGRIVFRLMWRDNHDGYKYKEGIRLAERRHVLGAGSNVAMKRPAVGAATFKATLGLAIDDFVSGSTIMLCNNCAEEITVGKVTTFTLDENGFDFTGSVAAGDAYDMALTNLGDGKTQYAFTLKTYKVTVPAVERTTVSVWVGDDDVVNASGEYVVKYGQPLRVTYAAVHDSGYEVKNGETYIASVTETPVIAAPAVSPMAFAITYEGMEGAALEQANPTSYTVKDETFTLNEPTKADYNFLGWYNGEDKVESIAKGSKGDLTLTAKWELALVTVTIADAPANMTRTITVPGGAATPVGDSQTKFQVKPGATVTVKYTANTGYMGTVTKTIESAANGSSVTITESEYAKLIVAMIGDVPYTALDAAIAAAIAANDGVAVEVVTNVNLTGVTWTPVTYPIGTLVIDGKGFTVTGMSAPLLSKTGSGGHHLTIKDIIFDKATVNDTTGYAGVICGYADSVPEMNFVNVEIRDSVVEGSNYAGAFVGYAAAYYAADTITFTGCKVTGCTITGGGSAGALIGHAMGNKNGKVTVVDTVVTGNTITSTGSSKVKAGSLVGTVGAGYISAEGAGKGGMFVSATVSGNAVTSGGASVTTIYGRQGTPTGVLTLTGGTYDAQPIADADAAWAKPAEGYIVRKNDATWGLVEFHPICQVGEEKFETLADAIDAIESEGTITLIADVDFGDYGATALTVPAGKAVTLDLAGKQISGKTSAASSSYMIVNKGDLTITDSVGNGRILTGADPAWQYQDDGVFAGSYASSAIRNEGAMTVAGGTIENAGEGNACYAIDNYGAATLTVTGGTLRTAKSMTVRMFYGTGSVAVSGGELISGTRYALQIMGGSTKATISGGTFTSENDPEGGDCYALTTYSAANASIEITGGTFNGDIWVDTEHMAVSGGTFAFAVPEEYCAEGYIPTAGDGGKYGVKEGVYVAQVGKEKFETLADAIAAIETTGTITLLADATVSGNAGVTIAAGKTVTLDLNGKTLTGVATEKAASQVILNRGALTICDSSEDETGKVTNAGLTEGDVGEWFSDPQNNFANNIILNCGRLTVESGTIYNAFKGSICFAVDNNSTTADVAFELLGGTVSSVYRTAMRLFCNSAVCTNGFTMSGGVISSTYCGFRVHLSTAYTGAGKAATVAISGGTVEATDDDSYAWYDYNYAGAGIWDSVDYAITGGDFVGYIWSYGKTGFISGGTYTEELEPGYVNGDFAAELDGGVYKVAVKYAISYELDGGTNDDANPTNYTELTPDIRMVAPTKPRYAFMGWYMDEQRKAKLDNGVIAKGRTGDITLYAKWEEGLPVEVQKVVEQPGDTPAEPQVDTIMLPKSYVIEKTKGDLELKEITEESLKADGGVAEAKEVVKQERKTGNKLTLVENYVLGLEPKVETSVPVVVPVQTAADTTGETGLTLDVGNIEVNNNAGAKVTYVLETSEKSDFTGKTDVKTQVVDKVFKNIELPTSGVKYYRVNIKVGK